MKPNVPPRCILCACCLFGCLYAQFGGTRRSPSSSWRIRGSPLLLTQSFPTGAVLASFHFVSSIAFCFHMLQVTCIYTYRHGAWPWLCLLSFRLGGGRGAWDSTLPTVGEGHGRGSKAEPCGRGPILADRAASPNPSRRRILWG